MSILAPSELKSLCAKYNLNPSKQYGQNYLISDAPLKKMIAAAELSKDDVVVEIGPGFGILTFALSPLVKKVVAFEIEKKLMLFWDEKLKEFSNVEIIWGNVLQQLKTISEKLKGNWKVVANLPYQITSHLLRTLLEMENKPERIIVMVQKEVAERICAKAGEMSLLAVSVQYYGEPKIITKVSRGSFWPSPSVDSAILAISRISPEALLGIPTLRRDRISPEALLGIPTLSRCKIGTGCRDDEKFFRIVKAGFINKRKQLWHNLSSHLGLDKEVVKNVLKEVVGNEKIRAEDLSVEDWVKIVNGLDLKNK